MPDLIRKTLEQGKFPNEPMVALDIERVEERPGKTIIHLHLKSGQRRRMAHIQFTQECKAQFDTKP